MNTPRTTRRTGHSSAAREVPIHGFARVTTTPEVECESGVGGRRVVSGLVMSAFVAAAGRAARPRLGDDSACDGGRRGSPCFVRSHGWISRRRRAIAAVVCAHRHGPWPQPGRPFAVGRFDTSDGPVGRTVFLLDRLHRGVRGRRLVRGVGGPTRDRLIGGAAPAIATGTFFLLGFWDFLSASSGFCS